MIPRNRPGEKHSVLGRRGSGGGLVLFCDTFLLKSSVVRPLKNDFSNQSSNYFNFLPQTCSLLDTIIFTDVMSLISETHLSR